MTHGSQQPAPTPVLFGVEYTSSCWTCTYSACKRKIPVDDVCISALGPSGLRYFHVRRDPRPTGRAGKRELAMGKGQATHAWLASASRAPRRE